MNSAQGLLRSVTESMNRFEDLPMINSQIFISKNYHTCRSRFFGLFENSPVSMLLFSPEGYVRAANLAFKTIFQTSAENLIAANFNLLGHGKILASGMADIIKEGFRLHLVELPETILFSGESLVLADRLSSGLKSCIYPVKDEDGDVLEVVMVHLDAYGGASAAQLLSGINLELENRVRKRTERLHALNEELMRSKMREASSIRARDEFFSEVSYELKTPLAAIKEASSMLSQGLYQGQAAKQEELFSLMQNECERLIKSVDSILDISKIQDTLLSYQFEPTDICSVIRECIQRLEPIARKKRIQVSLLCPSTIPRINTDQEKISLAMLNLIGNALKFTPPGGRVTTRVSLVKEPRPGITVRVSDTGKGIRSQSLDTIFNKFIRGGKGKGKCIGAGLGLFIVRRIILDHGGEIWVKSTLKKGSQFYFTLPVESSNQDLVSPLPPGQG